MSDKDLDKIALYPIQLRAVLDISGNHSELHEAGKNRQHRKIKWLLENGVNVEAPNDYGITPLHLASANGDLEAAEILLSHGARLSPDCCIKFPPLMCAMAARSKPLVDLFIQRGCNINELVDRSFGYLHYWVRHDDLEMLEFLLQHNADINNLDIEGATPLCVAVKYKIKRMLDFLLEEGAWVNDRAHRCRSALLEALQLGYEDVFEQLVQYTEDFSDQDISGDNILIIATKRRQHVCMRYMLESGAKPDAVCALGMTSLHHAVRANDSSAVMLLCQFEASSCQRLTQTLVARQIRKLVCEEAGVPEANLNWDTFSPLDFAILYDNDCIEPLLLSQGTKGQFFNKKYYNNLNFVKYCIKRNKSTLPVNSDMMKPISRMGPHILTNFTDLCLKELEKMKRKQMFGDVTYYKFLKSVKSNLMIYVRHPEVVHIFANQDYENEFPIYKYFLKWNYCVGQQCTWEYNKALDCLNEAFKFKFPILVLKKIKSYLNETDIKILKYALKDCKK